MEEKILGRKEDKVILAEGVVMTLHVGVGRLTSLSGTEVGFGTLNVGVPLGEEALGGDVVAGTCVAREKGSRV